MSSSPEASAGLEQFKEWKRSAVGLTLFCFGEHDFLSDEESGVRISSLGTSRSVSGTLGSNIVIERLEPARPRKPAIDLTGAEFSCVMTPEMASVDVNLSEEVINRFTRLLRVRLASGVVLLFAEPLNPDSDT